MGIDDILSNRAVEIAATAIVGATLNAAAAQLGPDRVGLVRSVAAQLLEHVPVEVLAQLIRDESVRRANALADLAERAKFGEDNGGK
jgi:hypothetical protein